MTSPRHRVKDASPRRRASRVALAVAVVAVLGVLTAGSFVGMRALADDAPRASSFTGVVTSFADGKELMCVRPDDRSGAPFCDLFYVQPGTPDINVGDKVLVTTIASETPDGSPISGMIVSPIP
jgi:hypothetical protein